VHQRQRAEQPDPLIRIVWRPRVGRPHHQAQLVGPAEHRRRDRPLGEDTPPHPQGEQVVDGDRPVRRHGVVQLGVVPHQHPAVGQLGQQPLHRLLQVDQIVLDQRHRGGRQDRLGQRRDAERRIAGHRHAAAEAGGSDRIHPDVVAAGDHRDDARELTALDPGGHGVVQCCGRHGDSLPAPSDEKEDRQATSIVEPGMDLQLQPLVHVRDMAASVAFYEHLGGEIIHGSPDDDWVLLQVGTVQIGLVTQPPGLGEGTVELNFGAAAPLATVQRRLRGGTLTTHRDLGPQLEVRSPDGLLIKINQLVPYPDEPSGARGVHDDRDTGQAQRGTDQVPAVRAKAVDQHPPSE
jgi:catechol 2,3-dioxygenase-like lactoylglutathione lyase family enzyme